METGSAITGEEGGLNDETALLVPFLLFVGSLMAVFLGARLFRPTAAIAAAMFGFYAVYSFGRMFSSGISCEALLGVASSAGLVAALATGCVLKAALFLIGSSATAAVVHLHFRCFHSYTQLVTNLHLQSNPSVLGV